MRIASRFSIAVHILAILAIEERPGQASSDLMASSAGVNPVVIRTVTGQLRRAGLVETSQGVAGARLLRPLADISLLDVYRAVEVDGELFAIHEHPKLDCPVGAHIQATLECVLGQAQEALEAKLGSISIEEIVNRIKRPSTA